MMTNPVFDALEPQAVWRHFAALCAIPRPSKHECASGPVSIGTFFSQGRDFLRPGDHLFADESEAREALSAPQLKWVLADPLIQDLLPGEAALRFTPLPHRAISGRLYNESLARFFGKPPF